MTYDFTVAFKAFYGKMGQNVDKSCVAAMLSEYV